VVYTVLGLHMLTSLVYSIKQSLMLGWTVDAASFLLGFAVGSLLLLLVIVLIWLAVKL
jgi:hypothetical protein